MKQKLKSHVKIGDKVKVITGSQKGFIGTISILFPKQSLVVIDEILPRVKYVKKSQDSQDEDSNKKEIPIFIHVSNVMLWDKKANVASKIGYKVIENEKKRYFKKSGNLV